MDSTSKAVAIPVATLLLTAIGVAIYIDKAVPQPYADQLLRYLALVLVSILASSGFVFFVLPKIMFPFLSDAQRYGIDEYGIPQTPEYMKRKAAESSAVVGKD